MIMLNNTSCRTLLVTVALLGTTLGTNTAVVNAQTKTDKTVTTDNTADKTLFHKASNLLEAKLDTIDEMNPDHLTGLQNIDNTFYYFNDDGSLHTGWQKFGDNTVYYEKDGSMAKGLQTLDDKDGKEATYYFNDEGLLTTGWQTIDGDKYYFNKDGKAQTKEMKEGDTIYSFNSEGMMTSSKKEEKKEEKPVEAAADNTGAASSYTGSSSSYAASSDTSYQPSADNSASYTAPAQQEAAAPAPAPAPAAPVSDGALGTLSIGWYSARVFQGGADNSVNQPIVDAQNSAVLMNYLGRNMIADHAYQGFSVLQSCGAGSTGTFCGRTIVCASTYQGTNTGYGIQLADGRWADEVYDGNYIMYTCNDASGVSVTVTFWN